MILHIWSLPSSMLVILRGCLKGQRKQSLGKQNTNYIGFWIRGVAAGGRIARLL